MKDFEIVSEIKTKDGFIQVRKYPDGRYDVGNLIDNNFEAKHPDCGADGAIRAISHYLQSYIYKSKEVVF